MPVRGRTHHNRRLWSAVALLLFCACLSPQEPDTRLDRTPPRAPDPTRMRAAVPAAGLSAVSGSAGCVEPESDVTVRRTGTLRTLLGQVRAAADGSFHIEVAAALLERVEVASIDAAGNSSPTVLLAIGAPFQLLPDDPAPVVATAGDSLLAPLAVQLRDESGAPVVGETVTFQAESLSPALLEVQTTSDGRAVWSYVAPTRAGAHQLGASVAAELLAPTVSWSLEISPAPLAGLVAVAGSEQLAAPATPVADALVCRTVDRFGNGVGGEALEWSASGGTLANPQTISNPEGEASTGWTLPAVAGEATVTVRVVGMAFEASFVATASGPPSVSSLDPDPVSPGATLTVYGANFSRAPLYDEVWFTSTGSETAGEILEAGSDRLLVRVPASVQSGPVRVRVCGRDAASVSLAVELALGTVLDVPLNGSLQLETPTGNEEFILALYSDVETSVAFSVGSTPAKVAAAAGLPEPSAAEAFHHWLRIQEQSLRLLPRFQGVRAVKLAATRIFRVLSSLSGGSYDTVNATLRYTGAHVLVYVDDRVPSTDLNDADVTGLGAGFDGANGAYSVVRSAFGAESDVDGDGRLIVLLTPTVNMLTPAGSGAYVGGFFFAQDLHDVPNSNLAEMIYTLVPDPNGRWGNVFAKKSTLAVLDGVLPHEFQHLVSYNQHVLERHGAPEELWLNEGLSHVAEGLVGEMQQNVLRGNLFLANPHLVSLTAGGNTLEERGMSFLFARFAGDQQDGAFFGRLVQTSRLGRDNFEHASGRSMQSWLRDWAAALYLDHSTLPAASRYRYLTIDFARDFAAPRLDGLSLGAPSASGSLQPGGMRLYRLAGTQAQATTLEVRGARAVVIRSR